MKKTPYKNSINKKFMAQLEKKASNLAEKSVVKSCGMFTYEPTVPTSLLKK
ncbi:cyclic lactone autoinducer peptide [Listeria booriae]|uniref:AgrD family cyclic lactone autoinducer peptide n=1 Tax=Listeria booriae TaxID=1552123 RepID=UPI0016284290|nr:cyclic lactone autoinducer peptide [Listeria booriae]MBC1335134.1 cyclic lactone autoinducer peptide [Listeria booriae]MBC1649726.1 cyclic lactone autoinducer peptide [Listeria booriae]